MATSSYITLDELSNLIKKGAEVTVLDAKTNEDLTRVTLTQIILEHEADGYNMLPLEFLRQIIKLYDDKMAGMFRAYLSYMLELYVQNQDQMQKLVNNMNGGANPFADAWMNSMDQAQQQGRDFFDQCWKAWYGHGNTTKTTKDGTSGQK